MAVSITTQPSSQKVIEGAAVQLSVVATGLPQSYQWHKDGVQIPGATGFDFVISAAAKVDQGRYYVLVIGSDGSGLASQTVTLEVSADIGLVPLLTANSGDVVGLEVIASSEASGNEAYRAFDRQITGGTSNGWSTLSNSSTGWLQVKLAGQAAVRRYRIYPSAVNYSPLSWMLLASNDGTSWSIVDSHTRVTGWTIGLCKEFTFSNSVQYSYYKLNVTATQSGSGQVAIAEWILFNDAALKVVITAPASGTRVTAGTTVTIVTVPTTSQDRSVAAVYFYANSVQIGTVTEAPYKLAWLNPIGGSYSVSAVVVNDIGERSQSSDVLLVLDQPVSGTPPLVVLKSPVNGCRFLNPAAVPIEFEASSLVATIASVDILINGNLAFTTGRSYGTYYWRQKDGGNYAVSVRATDSNGQTAISDSATISIYDAADLRVNFGSSATMAATDGTNFQLPNVESYVWRFWDQSVRTTTSGVVQKLLNRPTGEFTAAACDSLGRYTVQSFVGLTVNSVPTLANCSMLASSRVLPYSVVLAVSATLPGSVAQFAWRNSDGKVLAVSQPSSDNGHNFVYSHTVTKVDEKLYLIAGDAADWTSQITVDLTLPGKELVQPSVTALSTGMRPKTWSKALDPVYCAATERLPILVGTPEIDGVLVPAEWVYSPVIGGYTRSGGARILVSNQLDAAQNGIYRATSSRLPYYIDASDGSAPLESGKIRLSSTSVVLSQTSTFGLDLRQVTSDLLKPGRQLLVTDTGVNYNEQPLTGAAYALYAVNSVVASDTEITASVSMISSAGSLDGASVAVDFGWIRADDELATGATVRVINGVENGGASFSVVSDAMADSSAGQYFHIVKSSIQYTGTAEPGSIVYCELTSSDESDLDNLAVVNFLGTNGEQVLDGQATSLVRAKAITDGLAPASYDASVTVSNQTADFVLSSTAKGLIPIIKSAPVPPKPTSAQQPTAGSTSQIVSVPVTSGSSTSGSGNTSAPINNVTNNNVTNNYSTNNNYATDQTDDATVLKVGPNVVPNGSFVSLPGVGAVGSGFGKRRTIIITNNDPSTDIEVEDADGKLMGTVFAKQAWTADTNADLKVVNTTASDINCRIAEFFHPEVASTQ